MKIRVRKIASSIMMIVAVMIAGVASAQKTVDVTVKNNVFIPKSITIDVGDTVRWTNVEGWHNVNGSQGVYQSNPESFGNEVAWASWEYKYVFKTPGFYEFQCDPHVQYGMIGDITVLQATGIDENPLQKSLAISNIYPMPAPEYVVVELSEELLNNGSELKLIVYDLLGKEVAREVNLSETVVRFSTSELPDSMYILKLISDSYVIESRKIITR